MKREVPEMKRPSAIAAALSLLIGAGTVSAGCSAPEKAMHADGTIRLDPAAAGQTIAGFGASGCWWAKDVGGWESDKTDRITEWLFDQKKGIGLNIYRFEVGGGEVNNSPDAWRRAETFETAPGQYDWNRDANSVAMLKKAVAAGVDNVMFFANTPPGRLTVSGKTTGADDGASNLKQGADAEFAKYLVDIALHFKDEGIPVKYISPVNEPQWNWKESNGQEGCHYTPEQVVALAEALAGELAARAPDMKPSLIDSGKWLDKAYTVDLYKRLAENAVVGPQMDHYAVHSYWTDSTARRSSRLLLEQTGVKLPLWQTEWCQMESGRDLGMDAALVLAECVHEDMTVTQCSAWIAWLAVSCYDYKDGLVYVDLASREVMDSRRMWALGNYSRFVREGYRRIGAACDSEDLLASAYMSPDGNTQVLVCVNSGDKTHTMNIVADGLGRCEAYETSQARALEKVSSGSTGAYSFPAGSVTTLVLTK